MGNNMRFVFFFLLSGAAFALDIHPDYRYAYVTCPTWGTGAFGEVQSYLRVREGWDVKTSNYPVDWQTKVECRYKSDPAPIAAKGEYIVQGNLCKPKTVVPKVCQGGTHDTMKCHVAADCPMGMCVAGTDSATGWPVAYISVSADFNGGGTSFPSGCIWPGWVYGAPPAM
jgi:hypothetical protein